MPDTERRLQTETGVAARVARLVEPVIDDLGFRLVRVRNFGDRLQIMAERPDGTMNIAGCEEISRSISPVLDVNDPLSGRYHLEVSSPGVDRPLVRPGDFERWAGHEARIELSSPLAGRRRFRGRLEGFSEGEVRLFVPPDKKGADELLIGLPFDAIAEAKLVMTDELLAAAARTAGDGEIGDGADWHQQSETTTRDTGG